MMMGFDEDDALMALKQNKHNIAMAAQELINDECNSYTKDTAKKAPMF